MDDVQDGIYDMGTVCNLFVNMDNNVVVGIDEIVETSVWSQEDIHMVIMYDDLTSDIMTSHFMLEEQKASDNGEICWELHLVICTQPGANGSWNVFAFSCHGGENHANKMFQWYSNRHITKRMGCSHICMYKEEKHGIIEERISLKLWGSSSCQMSCL